MKFDVIIIGGGQSGLTKGTELAKAGRNVAVVCFGKSTMSIRYAANDLNNYTARLREGVQMEDQLRREFRQAGGTFFDGDMVTNGSLMEVNGQLKVTGVVTEKLQDETLYAEEYYLASGTFVSRGLRSNYQGIFEPVFGLDVEAPQTPAEWITGNFFDPQPFMQAHVKTTAEGKALKGGREISNLYCIGSIANN